MIPIPADPLPDYLVEGESDTDEDPYGQDPPGYDDPDFDPASEESDG